MLKKLLPAICLFFIMASLHAQTTYTSADYGSVGDSLFYTNVILGSSSPSYDYSQAGANVSWNFSSLAPTTQFNYYFLDPTTVGYRGPFVADCEAAGGTLANCRNKFNSLTNVAFTETDTLKVSNYEFDNIVTDALKTTGSLTTNIIGMEAKINDVEVPFAITYNLPDIVYVFPLVYGNSDSCVSSYEVNLNSEGLNLIYRVVSKRVNEVEGWGSITTPYANYSSALMLRTTILHMDTIFYDNTAIPVPITKSVEYSWFDPANVAAVFTVNGTIVNGVEKYTSVTYIDTLHCLQPLAVSTHTPLEPIIDSATGSVTLNFYNLSTNANNYYWNFGDPGSGSLNTSTVTNPNHAYSTSGTYTVQLVACNTTCQPEKCDTEDTKVIIIDSTQVHAAFVADPSITCTGTAVTFTNNSTNASSYYWNFGDQHTSTKANPTHTYTTAATYTVELIAYSGGSSDTARRTVIVQSAPNPVINATGPTTFCNGDSVILYATGGGGVYQWSNGELGSTIAVRVSGTYKVTSTNGCGTAASNSITVTVNTPVDTIIPQGSTSICNGDSVELQANTATGAIYQWKKNGQDIIGATGSNYYAKTQGNYTVNVTTNGCKGLSSVVTVTVKANPVSSVYTEGSTVICSTDSLELFAAAGTGDTYQWQLGGQNINGATRSNFYAETGGTYDVTTTHNGCSAISNGIALTVNVTPAPTLIYGSPAICSGDSFFISTQNMVGYTYQWQGDNINIPGATNFYYYAKLPVSYKVVATANGCSGTSGAVALTVNPNPMANAGPSQDIIACGLAQVQIGGSALFPTASGGTGPYTIQWTPASGLDSSNVANPTVSHLGSTTTYTVKVTDSNGCSAIDSMMAIVLAPNISVSIQTVGSISWCFGAGDSVIMTADVSGGNGSNLFNWSSSGFLSSTTSSTTVAKPTAAGSYNYSILVTDGNGCQAIADTTITVYALPVASITALDTTVPCSGDSVNFTSGPGNGYTYQWLDHNVEISGATGIDYAAPDSGTYSVAVTSNICTVTSSSIPVSVRPNPIANITFSGAGTITFCQGGGVELFAYPGAGYSFQWFENDAPIADNTYSLFVNDSASFYVDVTLNGCTVQSNTVSTIVNPIPADSVGVTGATAFCQGDSVVLSASTGNGYSYQWMVDNVPIPNTNSANLTVMDSGTFNVVVSALSCSATSTGVEVTVYPYPVATIIAEGNLTFCSGGQVTLSADTGTRFIYQWLLDGSAIDGALDSTLLVNDTGTFAVVITQNICTTLSNSLTPDILPLPGASAYVNGTGNICPGDSITIYAVQGVGFSYQWQQNDQNIPGETGTSYTTSVTGDYDVQITAAGCSAGSNFVTITYDSIPVITQSGDILIASAGLSYQWYSGSSLINGATQQSYSPPSFGQYMVVVTDSSGCTQSSTLYDYTSTGISVVKNNGPAVSVYPNPAHESATILFTTPIEKTISVMLFDIIGNEVAMVYEGKTGIGNNTYTLSLSGLAQGVYLLRISDGQSVITKKVIKE